MSLMDWVGVMFLVAVFLAMIYPFDDDDAPREDEK
jgi:hypothetical protein